MTLPAGLRTLIPIPAGDPRSLHTHNDSPVVPERFQIVVASLHRREQVDDNVAEVHEYPAIGRRTLDPFWHALTELLRALQRRLREGSQLGLRFAAAEDEVIGKDGLRVDVKNEDVGALLIQ